MLFWENSVFYSGRSPCSEWHWFKALRNIKICRLSSSLISSSGDNIHCWNTACSVLRLISFTRTHLYLHAIVFPPNLREVGFSAAKCLWGERFHFTVVFSHMLLHKSAHLVMPDGFEWGGTYGLPVADIRFPWPKSNPDCCSHNKSECQVKSNSESVLVSSLNWKKAYVSLYVPFWLNTLLFCTAVYKHPLKFFSPLSHSWCNLQLPSIVDDTSVAVTTALMLIC